jgi:hypothetical protein
MHDAGSAAGSQNTPHWLHTMTIRVSTIPRLYDRVFPGRPERASPGSVHRYRRRPRSASLHGCFIGVVALLGRCEISAPRCTAGCCAIDPTTAARQAFASARSINCSSGVSAVLASGDWRRSRLEIQEKGGIYVLVGDGPIEDLDRRVRRHLRPLDRPSQHILGCCTTRQRLGTGPSKVEVVFNWHHDRASK